MLSARVYCVYQTQDLHCLNVGQKAYVSDLAKQKRSSRSQLPYMATCSLFFGESVLFGKDTGIVYIAYNQV